MNFFQNIEKKAFLQETAHICILKPNKHKKPYFVLKSKNLLKNSVSCLEMMIWEHIDEFLSKN